MTTERVTVSLPEELRRTAARIADERGVPFSTVVAGWMRGRLVDEWLAEHQAEHGAFEEDELRELAVSAGVQGRFAEHEPGHEVRPVRRELQRDDRSGGVRDEVRAGHAQGVEDPWRRARRGRRR